MTKRDLIKFMKEQKVKAEIKANQMILETTTNYVESIYTQLNVESKADAILPHITKIVSIFEDLEKEMSIVSDGLVFNQYSYSNIYRRLSELDSKNMLVNEIKKAIWFSSSIAYRELEDAARQKKADVLSTYDTVIQTLNNLPTAKDGEEYLKKLGFDLSEIMPYHKSEKQLPATISINVDVRNLLLPEKEENS